MKEDKADQAAAGRRGHRTARTGCCVVLAATLVGLAAGWIARAIAGLTLGRRCAAVVECIWNLLILQEEHQSGEDLAQSSQPPLSMYGDTALPSIARARARSLSQRRASAL